MNGNEEKEEKKERRNPHEDLGKRAILEDIKEAEKNPTAARENEKTKINPQPS